MKVKRTSRLDSEYQKAVAGILNGSLKHKCPQLDGIISVTGASVSPDLKNARILVSIYAKSTEAKSDTFRTICENAGFIRHELAQIMRMRTVPNLQFILDNSMEYGAHMDELFLKIHQQESKNEEEE